MDQKLSRSDTLSHLETLEAIIANSGFAITVCLCDTKFWLCLFKKTSARWSTENSPPTQNWHVLCKIIATFKKMFNNVNISRVICTVSNGMTAIIRLKGLLIVLVAGILQLSGLSVVSNMRWQQKNRKDFFLSWLFVSIIMAGFLSCVGQRREQIMAGCDWMDGYLVKEIQLHPHSSQWGSETVSPKKTLATEKTFYMIMNEMYKM